MAACFHRKLINHMTLVLEPVDYTLNYLLHQLNKTFTILESISVVQQIASAALYLQECGYIHSNISSHNILVRERPWSVKLSSFELATDIDCADIRAEVEINCPQWSTSKLFFNDCATDQQSTDPEEKDLFLKEQYMEMSKRPPASKRSPNPQHEFMSTPSKYLIYDTKYRQCLSLHNFSAPELLSPDERFVFPTTKTDVYSLCLLLWEILNRCVPFAVYSKLDMERMIATKKLNLPFFERQRCYYFMEIFSFGLAVKVENRYIDVQQLIEMLEDVELEILTERNENSHESKNFSKAVDGERLHTYVNFPQRVPVQTVNDTMVSSNREKKNTLACAIDNLVLSPSLLDFNKSLTDKERTSTRKLRKKPPRKFLKHQIRELFAASNESPNVPTSDDKEEPAFVEENLLRKKPPRILGKQEISELFSTSNESPDVPTSDDSPAFVDLNENFSEEDYDILDGACGEDEKLNNNLAHLADDIRRNILNDTEEVTSPSHEPKTDKHKEPLVKKNDLPLKMPIEQRKQTFKVAANKHPETTPTVVGFSIKANRLNNSKTSGNLLETPSSTSGVTRQLFNSKIEPSPSGYRFNNGEYSLPDTPIARQNYIRRNAWLSNQQSSSNNEDVEKINDNEAIPLHDDKKLNVSVRIVHNKVTPKKVDDRRPSILSKINFFNSATETVKPGNPLFYDKCPITPVKVDDSNNVSSSEPASMLNEPISELTSEKYESDVRSGKLVNEKTTIITELKDSLNHLEKSPLDQPQQKHLFENKLWKRELDICNRSLTSNDGENKSKVVTPKWRSVRDTIMKFEKRGELIQSPTQTTPTELVKSLPKTSHPTSHPRKLNDSPTLIKRTIYSESILSGVDNQLQMPIFDQKIATRVSLRQFRQRSSDVSLLGGPIDVRHTICGSELKLLTFNAELLNDSTESGSSCPLIKYVCFNCASKMSSEEIKQCEFIGLELFEEIY